MDAGIQAMDGIQSVAQVLDSENLPTCSFLSFDTGAPVAASSLPSLDAGFRHPCRNDGPPTFVYNDERGAWERCKYLHVQRFHLKNIPKTDIPLTLQVNRITCAYIPTIK